MLGGEQFLARLVELEDSGGQDRGDKGFADDGSLQRFQNVAALLAAGADVAADSANRAENETPRQTPADSAPLRK